MAAPMLIAARAAPYLKRGMVLITAYRALPPEKRAVVQAEAVEAMRSVAAVKTALAAGRSDRFVASNFAEARGLATDPEPSTEMARRIVRQLQVQAELTTEALAAAVGATGTDDTTFKNALQAAQSDGYVRRSGVTMRGIKWDVTEWADRDLLDTPHVRSIEDSLIDAVSRFGILSLDHLSTFTGIADDAPELRAALERALANERVSWYTRSVYGLAVSDLAAFVPERDVWDEAEPEEEQTAEQAIGNLKAALAKLGKAIAGQTGGDEMESLETERTESDPIERLRSLQALHAEGVVSDAEFEQGKKKLLAEI